MPAETALLLFPRIGFGEVPAASFVLGWCAWLGVMSWILVRWANWRGSSAPLMLNRSVLGLRDTALLIGTATILCVAFAAALAFAFPDKAASDDRIFRYYVNSAMAPVLFISGVVAAPVAEELMFRGLLLSVLSKTRLGSLWSAIILSLIWSLIHGYGPAGTLSVFLTGLTLGAVRQKTKSTIPCMLVHGLNNSLLFAGMALGY